MACHVLVRHRTRLGGGALTPSQQWLGLHSQWGYNSSITGASNLAMACQRARLPPVLLSPPKQKEWLITPSCCMPIKYHYSCFVYKNGTGGNLKRVPRNICGFGTNVKDFTPLTSVHLFKNKSAGARKCQSFSWDIQYKTPYDCT